MKAVLLVLALACLAPALGKRSLMQAEAPSSGVTDTDLLNFALNLEYLEAEFYSCAANGQGIPSELRGGGPASDGCEKANLTSAGQAYADEIAADELNHVRVLRQALGSDAVAIPKLNIGSAFADAADAAFNTTLDPPFSPYLNDLFFYHGAFIFEDVGVTAYLGAAGAIESAELLVAAAKILAVEAYHSGTIRTLLYQNRSVETPYNETVANVIAAISDLRDTADGSGDDDQGIVRNGQANIVPTDNTSLAFARTPDQVVDIVTLGSGPSGGGFYPNGLNGAFGASSSS